MLRNLSHKKNESGFTLVELMVVVAIIGILLVIGVPQYAKFQAKARQTEIKNQLGAVYTAETSFAAENNSFTACLGSIGFNRDGARQYYWVGFPATPAGTNQCSPNGTRSCTEYQWVFTPTPAPGSWGLPPAGGTCADGNGVTFFQGNIAEGTAPVRANIPAVTITGNTAAAAATFIIGGTGQINRGQPQDQWTINNTKQLINNRSGL